MLNLNSEPIIDNCDKIIYYDSTGRIVQEDRVWNTFHQHNKFQANRNKPTIIKMHNINYLIVHSRIEDIQKITGTIYVTHIMLNPLH